MTDRIMCLSIAIHMIGFDWLMDRGRLPDERATSARPPTLNEDLLIGHVTRDDVYFWIPEVEFTGNYEARFL